MKVCILSESSADETALKILVEGLLAQEVELALPEVRSRGWPAVLTVLPSVFKHLHYHTDAEALVLVVDSNGGTAPHAPEHEQPDAQKTTCRLCQLRAALVQIRASTSARQSGPSLKTAIGLAVPAIEAWYRFGLDPNPTEAAWIEGIQSKKPPYTTRSLKIATYGTDRPSLELETKLAAREARRLVEEARMESIEQHFPNGFGPLARDVRSWAPSA